MIESGKSAFAITTYKGKFLLMLRDNKPTIPAPNCWSLLGGVIDPGETPEQAVIRELKEEANIQVQHLKYLFDYQHAHGYTVPVYSTALYEQQIPDIHLGDEGQKLDYFSLEELHSLPLTKLLIHLLESKPELLEKLTQKTSVAASLITNQNKILLIKRDNKFTIKDPNCWDIIGGHIEEGEDPDTALKREVQEEIGLTVENIKFIKSIEDVWGAETSLYHINVNSTEQENLKLGDEGQEIRFFTRDELNSLELSHNLQKYLEEGLLDQFI